MELIMHINIGIGSIFYIKNAKQKIINIIDGLEIEYVQKKLKKDRKKYINW